MAQPQPFASPGFLLLEQHLSPERLSGYVIERGGRLDDAIELYAWNGAITAAFWEQLGHVEVLLRNTLDARLSARHSRLARPGTWLTDQACRDITTARSRVRVKKRPASHGQSVSELSFGLWRFPISKKYTSTFWPDLASGFPRLSHKGRGGRRCGWRRGRRAPGGRGWPPRARWSRSSGRR